MVLYKDIHKTHEDLLNKDWYAHAGLQSFLNIVFL